MKEQITKTLIAEVKAQEKIYEINDTELPGFAAVVRPSGSIVYIVSYRYQGKRNRITIGNNKVISASKAREQAKAILAGLVLGKDPAEIKLAKKAPPKTHTLESFIDDEYKSWLETHRKDGKNSIKRIKSAFKYFLKYRLNDIDIKSVEAWKTTRSNDKIKPSTINRDINALKSLLSTAVSWKTIDVNVLLGFELLHVDNDPPVRYLSNNEEKRLTQAIVDRERAD